IIIAVSQLKFNIETAYRQLKTLMQYDSVFEIPFQELSLLPIKADSLEMAPGMQLLSLQTDYLNASLKAENRRMFPDISLEYFMGTNRDPGWENYPGVMVGLSVPLFFGEQKAKINANQVAVRINENIRAYSLVKLKGKRDELKNELLKYQESINNYSSYGKQLSEEIVRTAQRSHQLGAIDFFEYTLSLENALKLTLDYLDNVSKYNQVVLEINYLTN
ncbi:MAG TPA: TolC family protein, partial [Bacteroidales bacterium]